MFFKKTTNINLNPSKLLVAKGMFSTKLNFEFKEDENLGEILMKNAKECIFFKHTFCFHPITLKSLNKYRTALNLEEIATEKLLHFELLESNGNNSFFPTEVLKLNCGDNSDLEKILNHFQNNYQSENIRILNLDCGNFRRVFKVIFLCNLNGFFFVKF